jgi:hypothetical protein
MARTPGLRATASGGGHWIQLPRLRSAFEGWDAADVSMFDSYVSAVPGRRYCTVPDASRFNKLAFIAVVLKGCLHHAQGTP